MSEYQFRALIATKPTLKWFLIIGIVSLVLGFILAWIWSPIIGVILQFVGILLIVFTLAGFLYLWATDRLLPQPR